MKLKLELDDGRVFEGEGNPKTFMCLGDRIAFERQFKVSSAAMGQWEDLFDDEGKVLEGADLSGIREEWFTFLCWRELRRRAEGVPEWPEVVDHAIEFDLAAPAADPEDPTATTEASSPPTES